MLRVEDHDVNALLMQEMSAQRDDIRLDIAASGEAALAAARMELPDLLLDMNLCDMGGLELLPRLRGEGLIDDTRCVAVSADAMRSNIDEVMAAGLDGYLTKPIDLQTLFGAFDEALRSRSITEQAPG